MNTIYFAFPCGVIVIAYISPQTHPTEHPPEAHGGPSVWATCPGSPGHQLRQTLGQSRSGGHPVPAEHCQNPGVGHQRGQPVQQDQRQAGGQRQRWDDAIDARLSLCQLSFHSLILIA